MRSINGAFQVLIVLLIVQARFLAFAQQTTSSNETDLQKLEVFLTAKGIDADQMGSHGISQSERSVLEAGETAIPLLKTGLSDGSNDQRRAVGMYLLSLVGTNEARDILRHQYNLRREPWTKVLLIFCMSVLGDHADVPFLIDSLKGEHYGDEWPPIEQAALALGILRAKEAIPALKSCASEDTGSIASDAAKEALKWMTHGPPSTPQINDAPEREQILLTMFRSGIPRTDWANVFYEEDHHLKWSFANGGWTFQKVVFERAASDAPSIRFDVHVTKDHSKALVAVGMTFGPLNGKGYNYLLKKVNGQWKVVAMLSTWIS
jgi:hypothetical protein